MNFDLVLDFILIPRFIMMKLTKVFGRIFKLQNKELVSLMVFSFCENYFTNGIVFKFVPL